ncbi:Hypothetical predicted protein [Lecanosticta acicola]|uniref:CID domain-containing protein n=1 Tax=Lecanosticta acicola TaxID=111012 RepID=A0AAI9E7R3_9PEZI|nr:Hypothetical predicted protein [Lecanosticta acicola]
MADEEDIKEFPDVSEKLKAPKKISAFEKERLAAEEKKRRAEEENAAALRDFEASFGGNEDDDRYDGFPRMPSGPRGSGNGSGVYGGPQGRLAGGPRSGPGSLGPIPGPPPNLKRKRALDEMREAQEARRELEALQGEYVKGGQGMGEQYSSVNEDDVEDVAPRPTVQLTGIPPSMTEGDVKVLLRGHLTVHQVSFQPPSWPGSSAKRTLTAIATLASDTSTSQIDAAISALKDKYLGNGFYLSISRHLSSTSLLPTMSSLPTAASTEPFGAQVPNRDQPRGGNSMRSAPPPSDFAPPDSYDTPARTSIYADATLEVQPPLEISTIRAIHTLVDRLLSVPDPDRALQLEAMLMKQPEVQRDERVSFLYDSKSAAGVYYRFLLWNDDDNFDAIQERKRLAKGPERIYDDIVIDWLAPSEEVPFADLSSLGEVIDHTNYESSEEDSDDPEERQFNASRREGERKPGASEKKHLTPLQVAKFAWLLSRLPSNHAMLRKGNIAPITSFAINHAGAGAEEIVDMMVLNVEKPFTGTQCAKFGDEDVSLGEDDEYEPDQDLPTIEAVPNTERAGKKEAEDPSGAKIVALYLINDILHNASTAGVRNAWKYRQLFENAFRRQKTFEHLGQLDKELGWGRIKADKWRRQIGVLFGIWETGSVFASEVFEILKKNFSDQSMGESEDKGQQKESTPAEDKWVSRFKRFDETASPAKSASPAPIAIVQSGPIPFENDLDGAPMDDVDGAPMEDVDGMAMDDLDGDPMDDDVGGTHMDEPVSDPVAGTPMVDAPSNEEGAEDERGAQPFGKSGFAINASNSEAKAAEPWRRRKLAEDMFADDSGEE